MKTRKQEQGTAIRRKRCALLCCCGLLLVVLPAAAWAETADEIIKKVEDNLNGKSAVMKITMIVKTKRAERTMKMQSWAVGKENMLNLIAFYHNNRRYCAGKRADKTPMEILTGKKQDKDWTELLSDLVEEKDPHFFSAAA